MMFTEFNYTQLNPILLNWIEFNPIYLTDIVQCSERKKYKIWGEEPFSSVSVKLIFNPINKEFQQFYFIFKPTLLLFTVS